MLHSLTVFMLTCRTIRRSIVSEGMLFDQRSEYKLKQVLDSFTGQSMYLIACWGLLPLLVASYSMPCTPFPFIISPVIVMLIGLASSFCFPLLPIHSFDGRSVDRFLHLRSTTKQGTCVESLFFSPKRRSLPTNAIPSSCNGIIRSDI